MNRYTVMYDEAAIEYVEACRKHNRIGKRDWKFTLDWLDCKLSEQGC